jgi:hypothetical protein
MNTSTNQIIKERLHQRSSQAPATVMKLTDSILNVGSTNISALITSTPIGLIAEQLQDSDKYTPPTIKPPDYIPSIRNPPLAPKRQNTRNVYEEKTSFFQICLFFSLLFSRQQYGFDDTTASASTATLLHRHELASTSLSDTRKTIGTRKVSLSFLIQINSETFIISTILNKKTPKF